jgi:hypothetical protein
MFHRCQRFTTNQYKLKRKGSNERSKENRRQAWSSAPDSVWCTRMDQLKLLSFGFLENALHYNSPDCPVCHAEQQLTAPTVICKSEQCTDRARRVRAGAEGAPDSEQWLSGAPPDCPVTPLVRAPMVKPQRLGDVAGAPDSVRWRTGLSGAPVDWQPSQRPLWWLGL